MSFVIALVIGVAMAAPVLALVHWLSRQRALDILAVQLGAIAAVYIGSSLAGGGVPVLSVEIIGLTGFVLVALYGRWGSPALLAAGYAAHGAWDFVHHLGAIPTFLPEWYAPFCLGYDFVVAGFVAAVFLRPAE